MSKQEVLERFTKALNELNDKALPFASILTEALELHSRKSKDYGTGQDPYANVRASEDFGVESWKGALIRSNDKITRLKQFAKRGSLANESAEDSLMDLCVYFPITLMLYREESKAAVPGETSARAELRNGRLIDPGKGYRLLRAGEVLQVGDEYPENVYDLSQGWTKTVSPDCPVYERDIYRRKV